MRNSTLHVSERLAILRCDFVGGGCHGHRNSSAHQS